MSDALSNLRRVSWRGIVFSAANLNTSFAHDLAEHKAPDGLGARQENTGRNPRVVTCTALFKNGLAFEPAVYGVPQFPDVFNAFLAACLDGSTGDFAHPTHGDLRVKFKGWNESLVSTSRDGASVDCTWAETSEDDNATTSPPAPLAAATAAAENLDAELLELRLKNELLKARLSAIDPSLSFGDALKKIQAAADTVSLLQKRGAASIARVQSQLDRTRDAINSAGDVTMHSARLAVETLQAALTASKRTIAVTKRVALFAVGTDVTLASLVPLLRTATTDLLRLNPPLAKSAVVPAGTVVRYYRV